MDRKTYQMEYYCSNCGEQWTAELALGEKAHDHSICPNCECSTGEPRKKFPMNPKTPLPYWPPYPVFPPYPQPEFPKKSDFID